MMGIGITELLLILAVVMLFFGGKKLPELGKGMGDAIRNFKKAMHEGAEENEVKKDT